MITQQNSLIPIFKFDQNSIRPQTDYLAIEEPMEIQIRSQLEGRRVWERLSVTMRSPGQDFDLTLGFLYAEGIIQSIHDIDSISHRATWHGEVNDNIVEVQLKDGKKINWEHLQRRFTTHSSCGVCGKASIESLFQMEIPPIRDSSIQVTPGFLQSLPLILRKAQTSFDLTGGLHAAGLFDTRGNLKVHREDVGRHNALDKLIGYFLQQKNGSFSECILLLSGRISFELIQKAGRAGIPIIAGIGAPSNLAVELAEELGITVVGFLKAESFNIYCHESRILKRADK